MSDADWSFLAPARRLAWDFPQAQALAGLALPPSFEASTNRSGRARWAACSLSARRCRCRPTRPLPSGEFPIHVIGMRYARMRRVADDLMGFFQAMMRADAIQRALGPGYAPIRATFEPW
ncbi:hypothetical protein ACOTCB_01555 [Achromobacter xylosoxidans]